MRQTQAQPKQKLQEKLGAHEETPAPPEDREGWGEAVATFTDESEGHYTDLPTEYARRLLHYGAGPV